MNISNTKDAKKALNKRFKMLVSCEVILPFMLYYEYMQFGADRTTGETAILIGIAVLFFINIIALSKTYHTMTSENKLRQVVKEEKKKNISRGKALQKNKDNLNK